MQLKSYFKSKSCEALKSSLNQLNMNKPTVYIESLLDFTYFINFVLLVNI